MGIVDRTPSLQAATRFARAQAKQHQLLVQKKQAPDAPESVQADVIMLAARRDFLAPADRGFLESIIEQSDLMPLRYLGLGQLAAAAVGRIDLGTRHSALGIRNSHR